MSKRQPAFRAPVAAHRWPIALITLLVLVTAGLAIGYLLTQPERQPSSSGFAINAALDRGSSEAGYAQVLHPRAFVFPADYGPHPRYRTEWWYFTGNLVANGGRRFGYELTLFRIALAPRPPSSPSNWATNQLYMAHFALTDVAGGRFHDNQRLVRGALGLAGASAKPFRVWVNDWRVRSAGSGGVFPWRLHARVDGLAVTLDLQPLTPVVPEGDHGFSRKSAGRGHASYYYSIPRLTTRGTIELNGKTLNVKGLSWLDREWSSGALGADQAGWDWFALQLDDGTNLMYYRLRDRDGGVDVHSAGSLIASDGSRQVLNAADVQLHPRRWWRSPDGARYPVAWQLTLPGRDCDLNIEPLVDDQELKTFVRYWEGAVSVSGHCGGAVNGHGYLELTGYSAVKKTARGDTSAGAE